MAIDWFVLAGHFRSKHFRVRLPNKQVSFDFEMALSALIYDREAHKVISRFPARLVSVRIDCAGTETYIVRIAMNSETMLVTEELEHGPTTDCIFDIILIHKPVRRMVTHH